MGETWAYRLQTAVESYIKVTICIGGNTGIEWSYSISTLCIIIIRKNNLRELIWIQMKKKREEEKNKEW